MHGRIKARQSPIDAVDSGDDCRSSDRRCRVGLVAAGAAEQAQALQTARDAAHAARGEGMEVREPSPELQKAQAMVDRLEADLEMARNYRSKWATRVAAGGLALTIVCGLGYLAARGA